MAVPQRRNFCFSGLFYKCLSGRSSDVIRVGSNKHVGTHLDRDRTLGVVTQRETGNSKYGCLLLQPAGVGHHEFGSRIKPHEVEISERLDQAVEQLSQAQFDAIILDLALPDSSGLDTLAAVREL